MTKIRLNQTHRDILTKYGQEKISSLIDREKEHSLYAALLEATNKAIRKKYPEEHMAILRLYKLVRIDRCVKFQFPSGRVDGFAFFYEDESKLADLPSRHGCLDSVVYPMSEGFETTYDKYAKVKHANDGEYEKKIVSFKTLVYAAKTLDDILEAIDLPDELQKRLGKQCTALVALSPDSLNSLKRDFALKTAA